MKPTAILCAALLVPAAFGFEEARTNSNMRAWYHDGTCLEFSTESTGVTTSGSTAGTILVGPTNQVRRLVSDRQGKVLFAYDVTAFHGGAPGTYEIQVRPNRHDGRGNSYLIAAGDQLTISVYGSGSFPNLPVTADGKVTVAPYGGFRAEGLTPSELAANIRRVTVADVAVSVARIAPTVSTARIFHDVHRGEAVKVDILQNSATGETISDVLRPSDEPRPGAGPAASEEFVLGGFQITINGERFTENGGAILKGTAALIYVPGHGAFYLSMAPAAGFAEVGHASRERLSFSLAGEYVEIAANRNVLSKSDYRVVWVKHDPTVKAPNARGVEIMTTSKVENLLPKGK